MSLVLLFHYLMLNMFRMLIHPSSGACDLFVVFLCVVLLWFDVCWCYGVVRLGWCGNLMQAEALKHYLRSIFSFRFTQLPLLPSTLSIISTFRTELQPISRRWLTRCLRVEKVLSSNLDSEIQHSDSEFS